MGGGAIQKLGYESVRLPREEYDVISHEALYLISKHYKSVIIPSYYSKKDFGDCDILVSGDHVSAKDIVENVFGKEYYKNDKTYSIPYKNFQIDLTFIEEEFFETSLTYYSWNDLGNLCGRGYHSLGLKYGHDGLSYFLRENLYDPTKTERSVIRRVIVSTNIKEIFEFGGYDYEEFQRGFNTLEDAFHWACRGKYFNPDKFKYENLNYENRTRNSKRSTYRYFLEWLEINKHRYGHFTFSDDKSVYFPMLCDSFPVLRKEYESSLQEYQKKALTKAKINGNLVMSWTGLKGLDVGIAMARFAESFPSKTDYDKFIVESSEEVIRDSFVKFIERNYNEQGSWS